MSTMKTFLALVLSFCFSGVFAQSLSSQNKKALKSYELANQLLSTNQYTKALDELKSAVSEDNRFVEAYFLSGDILRRLQRFEEAKENYKKVAELNPKIDPSLYFNLGESELRTGAYASALTHLKEYSSTPNLSEIRKKLLLKYLADAEFSVEALKRPVGFNPQNIGPRVNSSADEYLPVVTADENNLIFTRKNNNNEDFYHSTRSGNSSWQKASYLSSNINTTLFNEGSQCISPDGKYLFFTGCNRPDGLGRCDIYVCHREGNEWSKPFNLGAPVNGNTWESQPSISADGRTLYFVSSRPGGLGGFDIWKTNLLKDGSWSTPENLGPEINSPYDEESAFIHPDGKTIYFSSKGWPGLGGRDLFFSKLDNNGRWQKPVNLGYPINTYKDEGGLTVSTNGRTAYFSSDKEGGMGGMDLYSFELAKSLRPEPVTYVKGSITDAETGEALAAGVKVMELSANNPVYEDNAEEGSFIATMPSGKNYALEIEKEGYLFYSHNFSLKGTSESDQPFLIKAALNKIKEGGFVVLNNIFFDTNKFTLLQESKAELDQLISFLTVNPKVSIEISGHTDNVGDEKSNLLLSENRAKAVYQYLISNKISPIRLSYKGYGKTKPVADNATEVGRKQNRRTEFRITKI
ncbi:OmpA family protein [Desertivirga brevis]|uniref:OmpA family protein n=1 Tax=Desertivirga brevis TaxID=2810310 RepID=UPI001F61054B|nr:OmpA family protein [Pedobacter sp. SYSU D00873]